MHPHRQGPTGPWALALCLPDGAWLSFYAGPLCCRTVCLWLMWNGASSFLFLELFGYLHSWETTCKPAELVRKKDQLTLVRGMKKSTTDHIEQSRKSTSQQIRMEDQHETKLTGRNKCWPEKFLSLSSPHPRNYCILHLKKIINFARHSAGRSFSEKISIFLVWPGPSN